MRLNFSLSCRFALWDGAGDQEAVNELKYGAVFVIWCEAKLKLLYEEKIPVIFFSAQEGTSFDRHFDSSGAPQY